MPAAPRILLVAEAANPEWTSVPLEGWSHSRALAQVADVHVVTQIRNREAFLRAGLTEGEDFTAIDSEAISRPLNTLSNIVRGGKGRGWTTVQAFVALRYYHFERLVWKQFGARLRAREFDIVHRLTPLSPTNPSFTLAHACAKHNIPFMLGPLNGGVPWPAGFDSVRRAEREWLSYIRGVYKLMPGYKATRRAAGAIIVGSSDTFAQIDAKYREKCFYIPENAIDPARFTNRRTRRASLPLRGVFLGRLVPYKGADMLLEAAAPLLREGLLELEIIGEGPQRAELEEIIEREKVGEWVTMSGWVEHRELQDRLITHDLLTFPSIREFGGAVVLEAMAVGLAPLVISYGGPKELVTPNTGIGIEIGSRSEVVARLRSALERLSADPAEVDRLGANARERAHQQFTWSAKADDVAKIYNWLAAGASRPHFPMPIPEPPGLIERESVSLAAETS